MPLQGISPEGSESAVIPRRADAEGPRTETGGLPKMTNVLPPNCVASFPTVRKMPLRLRGPSASARLGMTTITLLLQKSIVT